MAFVTKYGSIWGSVPNTGGRVLWVAPTASYTVDGRSYEASDDQDGLSPERALRTIQRANVLATANAGEVIVLLPGTHSLTAAVTASVAGVTYMGLPGGAGNVLRHKTVVAGTTGAACFTVSAADVEFAYLHVAPSTAQSGISINADGDDAYVHHCSFDLYTPAASTSTLGVDLTGAASQVLVEHCIFQAAGAQGAAVDMTASIDSMVRDCTFLIRSGTWAAAMTTGAATARLIIKRCDFVAAGTTATMTAGIDGTAATIAGGVFISDCRFHSPANGAGAIVTPIDRFAATTAVITENYRAIADVTTSGSSSLIILID